MQSCAHTRRDVDAIPVRGHGENKLLQIRDDSPIAVSRSSPKPKCSSDIKNETLAQLSSDRSNGHREASRDERWWLSIELGQDGT